MKTKWNNQVYYFGVDQEEEQGRFVRLLLSMLEEVLKEEKKNGVVLLCIGTDRSTGDSLGPLLGYKLRGRKLRKIKVVGTLDRPVHAMNLEQSIAIVKAHYPDHAIIAVDASVGSVEHIGCITLGKGALRPGLGVCKDLRAVGDICITGIVGSYGSFDPLMLQSVRLALVMQMVDYLCESVILVERFLNHSVMV